MLLISLELRSIYFRQILRYGHPSWSFLHTICDHHVSVHCHALRSLFTMGLCARCTWLELCAVCARKGGRWPIWILVRCLTITPGRTVYLPGVRKCLRFLRGQMQLLCLPRNCHHWNNAELLPAIRWGAKELFGTPSRCPLLWLLLLAVNATASRIWQWRCLICTDSHLN